MILVYRYASRAERTADEVARLRRLAAGVSPLDLLVETGVFEQAVADALAPQEDDWGPQQQRLRALTLAAARAFVLGQMPVAFEPEHPAWPQRLRVVPPEGYVQYALHPADYVGAAQAYQAEVGVERARQALVVGVRSIGTSLSAAVAVALEAGTTFTIRPRGASGQRTVRATPALVACVRAWLAASGGDALLVDEGPGVTGETFDVAIAWLAALGVPRERIVLFPSRSGGAELAPPERRARLSAQRAYPPTAADARRPALLNAFQAEQVADLGAGRWRTLFPHRADLPADPLHERQKLLVQRGDGQLLLLRFAGFGRWGEETRQRAEALANLSLGAPVAGFHDGWLGRHWLDGEPLSRSDARAIAPAAERYLAQRAGLFHTAEPVDIAPLVEMLATNARDVVWSEEPPGLALALRILERLRPREAVVPDARLLPWEWLRTPDGRIVKTDSLDHGAGLRLPGPADPAWDRAGLSVEFGVDPPATDAVALAYRAAYAAAQYGAAELARREAATDHDRDLHAKEVVFYRDHLAHTLTHI